MTAVSAAMICVTTCSRLIGIITHTMLMQVTKTLKAAMQASVTSVQLDWQLGNSAKLIQVPRHLPPLFAGDRLIVYAISCSSDSQAGLLSRFSTVFFSHIDADGYILDFLFHHDIAVSDLLYNLNFYDIETILISSHIISGDVVSGNTIFRLHSIAHRPFQHIFKYLYKNTG